MSAITFEEFVDEALGLPIEQRTALVTRLIDSIDDAHDAISPAWGHELKRRVADIDAGRTELIDRKEVWKRVSDRFGAGS